MIIVTGAAGLIGSAFLWKLNENKIKDILAVDDLDTSEKWKNLTHKKYYDYAQKTVFLDALKNGKLNFKPKAIVHMGACSSTTLTDGNMYIETNYEYSKVLAEYAFEHDVPFIYASSAATYGAGENGYDDQADLDELSPLNMYGYSKHMFDLWLLRNDLLNKACGIKFFNVFGPNEYHKGDMRSVICKNYDDVENKGVIKLFKSYKKEYADGAQLRDFIYVKDAVEVMYRLLNNRKAGGIFNLGTGKARSWNDIANAMFAAAGKKVNIEYIEMPETLRPKYQYFTEAQMEKTQNAIGGFKFMELEDSVKDYALYLKHKTYL
jgi:ADP-L-glycero-D-manno-heptose 6-epimerase